ncbi:MFS transporter [Siminovitchia acidinfaciens]|uniref:MFS transporter n=1 Tax=Siminovitchia acidinfaciens TaxID=2321395 RepID=A0A429Y264_9BACI|nr:MFS transporter [Siminovitchia acidinfaciens]RST75300.1 MFS transporter [Siminovitchia acidinfaciens]
MRWVIVVFLFFLYIINYADKAIIGYAAVPIMEDLNLTYAQFGMVGSSFYWLFSVAGIIGAALSDKIGTKKMLAIMAIVWTISQMGAFVIYSLPLLIFSRVLLGAFEGPYYATAISHVSKWFPPERRAFAISLVNCGSMVAKLMAPLLVLIVHSYGWRIGFGFLGTLSLIWFILWLMFGREKPEIPISSEEPSGTLPKVKWKEVSKVFLSANFIFTTLAFFSAFWVLSWAFVWMPTYLTKVVHLSPMQMGYIVGGIGVFTALGSVLVAVLSDNLLKKTGSYRKSRVVVAGISLILGSAALFSTTVIHSTIGAIIALGLGLTLVNTMFSIAPQIANHLLPERKGLASGTLIGLANLAGIVGPLATGFVVQLAGNNEVLGFNYSVMLAATILLVFGLIFLIFTNPDKEVVKVSHLVRAQA